MVGSLSIVIATAHEGWPRLRTVLAALASQTGELGPIEVIVADANGDALPATLSGTMKHLVLPGHDVFSLRAAAIAASTGDYVALLEDHNIPRRDYCACVLRAFAEHPEAGGVVGVATNSAHGWLDEASFLLTWAPLLAPLASVPMDRTPPPGVVAYRRSELPRDIPTKAWLEYELPVRLRAEGRLIADDRIGIAHEQHLGRRAFALHYHAGRVFTGVTDVPVEGWSTRDRIVHTLVMPGRLVHQTSDGMRRSRWRRRYRLLSIVAAIATANAIGQLVGLARGPGSSAQHLE